MRRLHKNYNDIITDPNTPLAPEVYTLRDRHHKRTSYKRKGRASETATATSSTPQQAQTQQPRTPSSLSLDSGPPLSNIEEEALQVLLEL